MPLKITCRYPDALYIAWRNAVGHPSNNKYSVPDEAKKAITVRSITEIRLFPLRQIEEKYECKTIDSGRTAAATLQFPSEKHLSLFLLKWGS